MLVNHRVKMKESKNINEYRDLARELENLRNMKAKMILNVIGTLELVLKYLEELEIRGRLKTI